MRFGSLLALSVSGLLLGCYDFGKTYDPCLDEFGPEKCLGTGGAIGGTGSSTGNNPGVGGFATGGASGGPTTGGASSGGSATGGTSSGGSATGGAATGGSATGGAGTGGTSSTLVARAALSEACPSKQAVEIFNQGDEPIPLADLQFSATKTGFSYTAGCVLSGDLPGKGYVVFASAASGCTGVVGTCVTSCIVSFDASLVKAWFKNGVDTVDLGSFDDSKVVPGPGSCWAKDFSNDQVFIAGESLGEAN